MNEWVDALRHIEVKLSERKGGFAIFGAFLPPEALGLWDLVLSAPWARRDDSSVLELIQDEIYSVIRGEDLLRLSKFVLLGTWHPDVQEINSRFDFEHDLITARNEEFFGYIAEKALILTSKDHWRFLKQLFPANARFVFLTRGRELRIRIYWPLDDTFRSLKQSRNIILSISSAVLDEHLDTCDPNRRHDAEQKLAAFVADKLRNFDPNHDAPAGATPPRERWQVNTALFRRPKLAAG